MSSAPRPVNSGSPIDEGVAAGAVLERYHHRRVIHDRLELRLVAAQRRRRPRRVRRARRASCRLHDDCALRLGARVDLAHDHAARRSSSRMPNAGHDAAETDAPSHQVGEDSRFGKRHRDQQRRDLRGRRYALR